MMTKPQVIALCLRRCARYRDGRGAWHAEQSAIKALVRLGNSPLVALDTAAAARRVGEWIRAR